jgi:hypothetical protein
MFCNLLFIKYDFSIKENFFKRYFGNVKYFGDIDYREILCYNYNRCYTKGKLIEVRR